MPEFQYVARTLPGQQVAGTITAGSRHEAVRQLVQQCLAPMRVDSVGTRRARGRRIPARRLAGFFSQLSDLLHGGVPLLRSLEILADQAAHPAVAKLTRDLVRRVGDGAPLAEAMRQEHGVYGDLCLSIVQAGEEGGFLEEAL